MELGVVVVRRRTGGVGGAQCAVRPKTTHLLSVPKFLFRFVRCTDLIVLVRNWFESNSPRC